MAESVQEYKGHRIRIPEEAGRDESYIKRRGTATLDDEPIQFGQDAGGQFFLRPYAYDRDTSLFEVVKRFIDYRERVEAKRALLAPGAEED